jgi:signal peptidase II
MKAALLICVFILCTGCDLSTKWLAKEQLQGHPPIELISNIAELRYTENMAIAFSLLQSVSLPGRKAVIYITSTTALVILCILIWRWRNERVVLLSALVFILSGAVGNLVDRLTHGYVIDFIHLHYGGLWSWPVFNVADICVSLGAGLLIFLTGQCSKK